METTTLVLVTAIVSTVICAIVYMPAYIRSQDRLQSDITKLRYMLIDSANENARLRIENARLQRLLDEREPEVGE